MRGVFDSVAERYDLMNDLMSMGSHRLWKRQFVAASGVGPARKCWTWPVVPAISPPCSAAAWGAMAAWCSRDINEAMLAVGRRRLEDRGIAGNVDYALANAETFAFRQPAASTP